MINVYFNKGIFPDFLKVANVIPMHKKGEKPQYLQIHWMWCLHRPAESL